MCTCDECYEMRQPHIGKCPECGQKTLVSRVSGWSSVSECTNCHWGVATAGGFPQPCHVDDTLYEVRISGTLNNEQMVKLGKILSCNVLELKSEFENGIIVREYKVLKCLEIFHLAQAQGIDCAMDSRILQMYRRIQDCEFKK